MLWEAVAHVAYEQHIPDDEVPARHFIEHLAGADDEAALGVHVEECGSDDGVRGEGRASEHERVDDAAGGGVGEACVGAEGRGDGHRVGVHRVANAGLEAEADEEEVEDVGVGVGTLPRRARELLHP